MSTRENAVLAIGVIVLIIGAATGSAYMMLGLAAVGIVLAALIYRPHRRESLRLVAVSAVAAAIATGIAWSMS